MNTLKRYFSNTSKTVFTICCLLTLIYSQCSHAGVEKRLYKDEVTGQNYTEVSVGKDDWTKPPLTLEIAEEIVSILTNNGTDSELTAPVGRLIVNAIYEPTAFAMIINALQKSSSVRELDFGGCFFGDNGSQLVARLLKTKNNTWVKLRLTTNQIGRKGGLAIADALKTNETLTEINLAINKLDDVVISKLAEVLQTNTTLRKLDLSQNKISVTGVQKIVCLLSVNTSLTKLGLCCNNFNSKIGSIIADALQKNETLIELNLFFNNFGENVQDLVEAVVHNMALQKICITWLTQEQKQTIKLVLERNTLLNSTRLQVISQRDPKTNIDNGKLYNAIIYGGKEDLSEYFTVENFVQINKIRQLQIQIYKNMGWSPENIRIIEVK